MEIYGRIQFLGLLEVGVSGTGIFDWKFSFSTTNPFAPRSRQCVVSNGICVVSIIMHCCDPPTEKLATRSVALLRSKTCIFLLISTSLHQFVGTRVHPYCLSLSRGRSNAWMLATEESCWSAVKRVVVECIPRRCFTSLCADANTHHSWR